MTSGSPNCLDCSNLFALAEYWPLVNSLPAVSGSAAVAVLCTEIAGEVHILLTERAAHLRSHAGEVAFPGGKWEPSDTHLLRTAERETWEEVALAARRIDWLAQMPAGRTRRGVQVQPYLGWFDSVEGLRASPDELEALFVLPLAELFAQQALTVEREVADGLRVCAPAFICRGREIWGFTARVLAQLEFALTGRVRDMTIVPL